MPSRKSKPKLVYNDLPILYIDDMETKEQRIRRLVTECLKSLLLK